MDVLVEFRLPEPEERWNLWHLHLPPGHDVSAHWLEEVAMRCNLSGGQIRNAALHASLLALDASRSVTGSDVEQSIQREYRKMGAVCPLRRGTGGR
jgi:ATP-dependent 26S proteasome regulatory subunit